jgi:hypothetical protein
MEANWRRYFTIKWMFYVVCAIINTSINLDHIDTDIERYRSRRARASSTSTTRAFKFMPS